MSRSHKKYLNHEDHGSKFADHNEGLYQLSKNETINKILLYLDKEVALARERTFGDDPTSYLYALQELRKTLYNSGNSRECSGEMAAGIIIRWQNTQYPGSGSQKNKALCDTYFKSINGPIAGFFASPDLKAHHSCTDVLASLVAALQYRDISAESKSTGNETIDDILTIIDEEAELASERISDCSEAYLCTLQLLRRMLCDLKRRSSNQDIIDAIQEWREETVEDSGKTNEAICDAYFHSKPRAPVVGFFTPTYLKGHHFTAVMDKVIGALTPGATPSLSVEIG